MEKSIEMDLLNILEFIADKGKTSASAVNARATTNAPAAARKVVLPDVQLDADSLRDIETDENAGGNMDRIDDQQMERNVIHDVDRNEDLNLERETEHQPRWSEMVGNASNRPVERPPTAEAKQFKSMQSAIHRLTRSVASEQLAALSYDAVNIRYERLTELWEKANALYMVLISETDEHMCEAYEDCMSILEEEYYETAELLRKKISDLMPANSNIGNAANSEYGTQPPERPLKLIMPVQQHNIPNTWGYFDGDLTKWLGFRDRFSKAIGEEADVSDAWKHSHLLDSLQGQAKETLGKSGTVEGTFQQAWDRMKEIYDKPYSIARLQMREFFKLPHLQGQATSAELQKMSNVTHETIRQLHALQFPVDTWDFVFVHCLHERLDSETARQWNLTRTSEYPKSIEMTKFLDREAGASNRTRSNVKQQLTVTIDNKQKENPRDSVRSSTPYGNRTGAVPKLYPCEACPGGREFHKVHECPNYLALSYNGKKDFIARRRLCPNCLRKWHSKETCRDPTCPFTQCAADNFHNSTICPFKQGANKRPAAVNQA